MEKKQFLTFGAIMVVLVALAFVYGLVVGPSGDNLGLQFISKTEYVEGDVGQVIVELRTAMPNNTVIPASCLASIWYPNKTILLGNQSMANASSGSKYINFTVPSAEGVYEYQAVCSYVGRTYVSSSSFHVSGSFRLLEDDILGALQIIPQGVTQVEMGKTAAQSWLFESRMPVNVTDAFCSVYRLVNNTREFAAGQLYYYDFNTGIPDEINYSDGVMGDKYNVMDSTTNPYQQIGNVSGVSGKMSMYSNTGGNAWALLPGITQDSWELSLTAILPVFSGYTNNIHISLLGTDRDGGRKIAIDAPIDNARAPRNAMVVIGINDDEGASGRGWAALLSPTDGVSNYYPDGVGKWFVKRNTTQNGTFWAKTNATFGVNWLTANPKLVKSGDTFSLYVDNVFVYSWTDTLSEPIRSVVLSSSSSESTPTTFDNYDVRVPVSSNYSYYDVGYSNGEYTKMFTFYWTPGIDNTVRGENYVVDCDVILNRGETETQVIQNLVQYVYINRDGRIRAVIPR